MSVFIQFRNWGIRTDRGPTEGIVSFGNSKCPPEAKMSEDLCTQNALEAISK